MQRFAVLFVMDNTSAPDGTPSPIYVVMNTPKPSGTNGGYDDDIQTARVDADPGSKFGEVLMGLLNLVAYAGDAAVEVSMPEHLADLARKLVS